MSLSVPVRVNPELGTRLLRADVVPVSPRKWLADRLRAKNLTLDAFTLESLSHSETARKNWNGRLKWGDFLPVGKYRLAVRALRLFGDVNVESDWDVAETSTFLVAKGGGEKACEIYESVQAKIPINSLFDSHEECLEVQGDSLVDLPWITAPRDETARKACTDDNLTEKSCGTHRFCKAHDDSSLSHGLKSPFLSSWRCIGSHKLLPDLPGDWSRIQECMPTKDESICGSSIWCQIKFSSAQPTDLFGGAEECLAAHGL